MASTTSSRHASTSAAQPYIVTLLLDEKSHISLTALRRQHFPPHRNYLDAHVVRSSLPSPESLDFGADLSPSQTFFHALPASHLALYQDDLRSLASRTSCFPVTIGPPFQMGGGVGISILSAPSSHPSTPFRPLIESLHARLLKRWSDQGIELTNQDKQEMRRPHVTVQNKVEKTEAEETMWKISKRWKDEEGEAVGLGLYEYQRDGRWRHVEDFHFGETKPTRIDRWAGIDLVLSSQQLHQLKEPARSIRYRPTVPLKMLPSSHWGIASFSARQRRFTIVDRLISREHSTKILTMQHQHTSLRHDTITGSLLPSL